MRKFISILLGICLLFTVTSGCTRDNGSAESSDKVSVISTIFAPYDFVRAIAGDHAEITMLLPPDSESHSFEPTPQDIIRIQNCDVFIYVGGDSDAWVNGVLESMDTGKMKIITLMDCVEVVEEEIVEGMEAATTTMSTTTATMNENTPPVNSPEAAAPPVSDLTAESANHPDAAVPASSGDVIVIREKMFIAQTNDIYYNTEDYLGKTIKYEGIFKTYYWEEDDLTYHYVIRYGPGCCGNDGEAGFEVAWTGDYPNQDDWVETVGVLEEYEENGYMYLRLALTSLTVLPTRGAEYVSQ